MSNLSHTTRSSAKAGLLRLPVLRDVALIAVMLIAFWKLLNSDLRIDLEAFSFTDLLALVLALFSVALSVAFYFKATDASNQFYDNTYRFTKEMSEMLGRIEAGFGERLRHLDEGYAGMRDRLDRFPPYTGATHSDVKNEEEEIKRKQGEQRALIENLAQKAELDNREKQDLFASLKRKDEELEQARIELRQMRDSRRGESKPLPHRRYVLRYVAAKIQSDLPPERLSGPISSRKVNALFSEVKPHLAEAALKDMESLGLLGPDGELTRRAMMGLQLELRLD
jgi:hypothetical protein